MDWNELYGAGDKPALESIRQFVKSDLWDKLNSYVQQEYSAEPKLSYSSCSWQRGWNVKYQKGSKSLCTLYPMEEFFIALVVIGESEKMEMELSLPLFSDSFRRLYHETKSGNGQKWLMINVTDSESLDDVKRSIAIRRKMR